VLTQTITQVSFTVTRCFYN